MKNILNLFLAALLAVSPLAGKTQGVSLNVVGTQAEYQNNPIGIDYAPQLSWRIESPDRNVLQTAWRVLVASSPERLAADEGDIWDSGKVASAQSTCISTSHIPLTSRTRYYWKVKVWQDEAVSAWSEPAFFETGLLKASDWRGGWIGYVPGIAGRVLYFKASAHVGKPVAYARAYVAGIGYHSLYVNRKKVGDHVLDPAQSTYSKRVYYETYDIGPYLQEGGNSFVIPVAPGWLGTPRLRAQVEIVFTDGTFAVLNSDAFRHVIAGPTLYSTVFDGEAYDAREDSDDIWAFATPPGLMDDRWAWAHNTDDPVGELHAARVEPIRVVEELRPTLVGEPRPGVYVFDAGRNLAGWVALKVRGKAGDTIRLYFAETLRDDGSVNQDNLRNAKSTDAYTCAGTGEECWEPSFTYHGFRFFQVEGLPYKPADDDFTVKVVRTDVQTIGQVTCANDLVNRIHRMVVNTESSNLHSVPTDCPQRDERMGWLNDLTVSHEIAAYNFNMARFFPKGARLADTGLPLRAEFGKGVGGSKADPAKFSLLVMGGSQGAKAVNRAVVEALALLPSRHPELAARIRVVHLAGTRNEEEVRALYAEKGLAGAAFEVLGFEHDMSRRYAEADLCVSRAGASSCFELALTGLPAVFVPLPGLARDHQSRNAESMAARGAGVVAPQDSLSPESLADLLASLSADAPRRAAMRESLLAAARPDAASRVADEVERNARRASDE